MREERINRRITESIESIPVESLRQYLKDRIRFERSKMDRDQPYFKNSYREATKKFAPNDPTEFEGYDAANLTQRDGGQYDTEPPMAESQPIQIHEIRMKNWRQYGDEQVVDLSAVDGRLINIIEGQNGAGKSNFLNAITLCFYGKQVQERSTHSDLESQPFATFSRVDEVDVGDSVTGYIEVVLGISEPEYRFRREFSTTKVDNGTFNDTIEDLELRRRVSGEWKLTDNPSNYLNQVLPARVADYFLFDGEDLDVFFEQGYADRVRDAILDVSHLELLNRAIDHFEKIRSDFESEASDAEGEVDSIRAELEQVKKQLKERKSELEKVDTTIEQTRTRIDEIDAKLKDLSDEYVQQRFEMVDEKQAQVEQLEDQRETLRSEITDILIKTGPTLYAAFALFDAADHLNEIAEAGSLPPRIQRRFVSELIDQGVCICGRSIEDHSEEERQLEELRDGVFDVSEAQLEDAPAIPSLFEQTSEGIERLIQKRQTAVKVEDEIDLLKQEIRDAKRELEAYEIPDVDTEALENNRTELEQELDELRNRRARLEVEIEEITEKQDNIQEELHAELQKQEEHRELLASLSLINLAEDCLHHIRENILQEIRSLTESNISKYFNQLIWKKERYDIQLTDDYSIQVRDEFGENKIGSLSAGETQVLALSFMAALSQISGFDAPVVIDTPLGRISGGPRRAIAENLPKYMSNTQITFLMTDEEYTPEVRELMTSAVGREYRLVFEDNQTTIVKWDSSQEVDL